MDQKELLDAFGWTEATISAARVLGFPAGRLVISQPIFGSERRTWRYNGDDARAWRRDFTALVAARSSGSPIGSLVADRDLLARFGWRPAQLALARERFQFPRARARIPSTGPQGELHTVAACLGHDVDLWETLVQVVVSSSTHGRLDIPAVTRHHL